MQLRCLGSACTLSVSQKINNELWTSALQRFMCSGAPGFRHSDDGLFLPTASVLHFLIRSLCIMRKRKKSETFEQHRKMADCKVDYSTGECSGVVYILYRG